MLADRIVKDRKSRCRSTVAGRVRCAYFFWQGNDCSVNEEGAAAIMAVELDEEKGPLPSCLPSSLVFSSVSQYLLLLAVLSFFFISFDWLVLPRCYLYR